MKFNFLGGQHKGFSKNQNSQETVNMFLEVDPSEDNKLTLYRVDGKTAFLTLPTAPVYGMAEFRGCLLYTSPSPRDGLLSRMPSSA